MTQPTIDAPVSTAKPADAIPSKTEGVDLNAAMKAFKEERAKDKAAEAAEAAPKTDAPAEEPAKEVNAQEPPQTEVAVPEAEALKVKLRSKVASRQRELDAREQRQAAWEAELKQRSEATEAQQREIAAEKQRIEALKSQAKTDPRSVLRELGIHLPDVVNAELAEMSPEARAKQMGNILQNLPKLIEEKAAELVQKQLAEREQAQQKQISEAQRQQAIANSERAFIERAKSDAEKLPHLSKVASQDGRFAVHTAYYIQSVFQQEHGRLPSDKELDFNVNKYLGEKVLGGAGESAKSTNGTSKKTSPRAGAKEVAEKPVAEMSAEERLSAAAREFRRIREQDRDSE